MKTRLRQSLKWACLVLAAVLLAGHIASHWWYLSYQTKVALPVGESTRVTTVFNGSLYWSQQYAKWYAIPDARFQATRQSGKVWPLFRLAPGWQRDPQGVWLTVPLLYFVVLFGVLAGWLWWTDRQRLRRSGMCLKCGYDRRGIGGACPECGVVVA